MFHKLFARFRSAPPQQPEALISVLLDESAEYGDRLDAAGYLGKYDEPAAEEALLRIVMSASADEGLADSAGEALWELWSRKGNRDEALVARMHPAARKFFEK